MLSPFPLPRLWSMLIAIPLALSLACPGSGHQITDKVAEQFALAAGYYERGQYSESINAFRELIQSHPSTQQATISHFYLGEALLQLRDYQAAYPAYQVFLNRMPEHPQAKRTRFRLAECAFQLNWSEQATALLEDFVGAYPNDPLSEYALNFLGEIRLRRGEPQLAKRVFETALRRFPDSNQSNRSRFGLAQSMQMMGQFDQAIRFYQMLAIDRDGEYFAQSQLKLGVIAFNRRDYIRAREYFRRASEATLDATERVELKYWLAKTEMATGNMDSAFEYLSRIIDQPIEDEMKAAILFDAALAASRVDSPAASIRWLQRLEATWPNGPWVDEAMQLEIELLFKRQQYDQALDRIADFERQFPAHQKLAQMLEYRGRIHYQQQDYAATVATFQSLIDECAHASGDRYPVERWQYFAGLGFLGQQEFQTAFDLFQSIQAPQDDAALRTNLLLARATASAGLNRPDQVRVALVEYLRMASDGDATDRARSELAIACAKMKDWEQASYWMDELEQTSSHREHVLDTELKLAEYALQDQRFEEAEQRFLRLSQPRNPRFFVVRGLSGVAWTRMQRGDFDEPVADFRRLMRDFPDTPFAAEAALICGRHCEENGQFDQAARMYGLVATEYPDSEFAPKAILRQAFSLHQLGTAEQVDRARELLYDYRENQTEGVDEAIYQLAWVDLDSGCRERALAAFEEIVCGYPDSRYWADAAYRVAEDRLSEGDTEAAEILLLQLESDVSNPAIAVRVDFLLGQIDIERELWETALIRMQDALGRTDNEALRKKSRYWIAECHFHLGQHAAALHQLQRLADDPDHVDAKRRAWIHLRRAQCELARDNFAAAIALAREGLRQYPEFEAGHEFYLVIGQCHASQGRLADARRAYANVVASKTGQTTRSAAMAQWRIGETWFHQQEYEKAIAAFYKVDSLYAYPRWRAAALLEAGKCQEHLGNWKHAAKLYRQLIDRYPDSELQAAARDRLRMADRQASRSPLHRKK